MNRISRHFTLTRVIATHYMLFARRPASSDCGMR
ncbi:MAG: hypothetical protein ACI9W2_003570 [Gammaproteobacteria bacterium]|jgi:hypothetical protein